MSAVEEIRKAAALMRERAKAATGGGRPWFIADCTMYRRWILAENGEENGTGYNDDVMRATEEDEQFEVTDADWEHVASWHPQVALAIADWLELAPLECDCGLADGDPACEHSAPLLVARAYLGRAEQ